MCHAKKNLKGAPLNVGVRSKGVSACYGFVFLAFLIQSPVTYETSDIISTFVYRKGFEEMNYSYSTAVGLFNSVINLILLTGANKLSQKVNGNSLW